MFYYEMSLFAIYKRFPFEIVLPSYKKYEHKIVEYKDMSFLNNKDPSDHVFTIHIIFKSKFVFTINYGYLVHSSLNFAITFSPLLIKKVLGKEHKKYEKLKGYEAELEDVDALFVKVAEIDHLDNILQFNL